MDETNIASVDTSIPLLPLQWIWLHSCVAISCDKNQLLAVVNGVKVLNTQFEQKENTPCPTRLDGTLVLQKFFGAGFWCQNQGRVTNVNVFSGLMSEEKMVSRTAGEDCGKQEGDFLSWTNSSWSLQGVSRWTDVSVEELCREFSSIQLFSTQRVTKPDDCRYLCHRMHGRGRMASVETQENLGKLQVRLGTFLPQLNRDGSNAIIVWLPISKQKGLWLDTYTKKNISADWSSGQPVNDIGKECAFTTPTSPMNSWYCTHTAAFGGFFCSCDFVDHPFLVLRGLCKDSYLDQTYLPQNSPQDGQTTFYGNRFVG